jgi:hypothetical protein
MTLTRFCTMCKGQIEQKRVTRGSFYCTSECRDKAKGEMRQFKAEKACRLCGRPPLKPRRPRQMLAPTSASASDSVQSKPPGPRQTFRELSRDWENTLARIRSRKDRIQDTLGPACDDRHSDEETREVDKPIVN